MHVSMQYRANQAIIIVLCLCVYFIVKIIFSKKFELHLIQEI